MKSENNFLKEINYLRAFGVFFVLMIHISSAYYYLTPSSWTYKIWGSVNALCVLAVPLFLFISALVIAFSAKQKEEKGESFHTLAFYKRRLQKILPPYLLWSLIYMLFRYASGVPYTSFSANPWGFITDYLLLGKSYYHLYYIVIVLQLYLLFPIIMQIRRLIKFKAVKILPRFFVVFVCMCLLQYFASRLCSTVIYPIFPNIGSLALSFVLPIGMGLWFGFNIRGLQTVLQKLWWLILLVTPVVAFISVSQSVFGLFPTSSAFLLLFRMIYSFLAILLCLLLCYRLREGCLSRIFDKIGNYSFFIYLAHPLFLSIAENILPLRTLLQSSSQLLNFSCGILLCFIFTWCTTWLCACLSRKLHLQRFLG